MEKKVNVKQLVSKTIIMGQDFLSFQFPLKEECLMFWSLTKCPLLTSLCFQKSHNICCCIFRTAFFPFFLSSKQNTTVKSSSNVQRGWNVPKSHRQVITYLPDPSVCIYNLLHTYNLFSKAKLFYMYCIKLAFFLNLAHCNVFHACLCISLLFWMSA